MPPATAPLQELESADNVMEYIREDFPAMTDEKIYQLLDDLAVADYLKREMWNDEVLWSAREGLQWRDVCDLADPVKKKVLLMFMENPSIFFVIYNTQKGKLRIAGAEMAAWARNSDFKIISILLVSNDKSLADQSAEGLFDCFPLKVDHESCPLGEKHEVDIYTLSSSSRTSFKEIITSIDAYASPFSKGRFMPLIVALANPKQMEKIVQIIYYIKLHGNSKLRAGCIWDEADSIYPSCRDRKFRMHDGASVSFLDLLSAHDSPIFRTGFVTATEGELLEDYEECQNAYHYRQEMSAADAPNYRAMHHSESVIHHLTVAKRESNNAIALREITTHWAAHFAVPIVLPNGQKYYRKGIINSSSRSGEHRDTAARIVQLGGHCLTFNQHGLRLYNTTYPHGRRFTIKKRRFGEVLFLLYKSFNLNDAPLFIVGRRKVDRGLGFHYAPRGARKLRIEGLGDVPAISTDGVEGLIWTDIILGNHIDDTNTATQKAGRGAGIIAQCPQYPGNIHYWVEKETASAVVQQLMKVDKANTLPGANTVLQAVTTAERLLPRVPKKRHTVDINTFRIVCGATEEETLAIAAKIVKGVLKCRFNTPHRDKENPSFYASSLNNESKKNSLLAVVKGVKDSNGGGKNKGTLTYRRVMAGYDDKDKLHIVIPLIDPRYPANAGEQIDAQFGAHLVSYPQEDDVIEHV